MNPETMLTFMKPEFRYAFGANPLLSQGLKPLADAEYQRVREKAREPYRAAEMRYEAEMLRQTKESIAALLSPIKEQAQQILKSKEEVFRLIRGGKSTGVDVLPYLRAVAPLDRQAFRL